MLLLSSADFFFKITFSKILLGTLSVSNSLDPVKNRHSVGPDLGPNCLQRLSTDDKIRHWHTELKSNQQLGSYCKVSSDKLEWMTIPAVHCLTLPPGNFYAFCRLLNFFKTYFFKKFFHEYHLRVKQIGSRSDPTFCRP